MYNSRKDLVEYSVLLSVGCGQVLKVATSTVSRAICLRQTQLNQGTVRTLSRSRHLPCYCLENIYIILVLVHVPWVRHRPGRQAGSQAANGGPTLRVKWAQTKFRADNCCTLQLIVIVSNVPWNQCIVCSVVKRLLQFPHCFHLQQVKIKSVVKSCNEFSCLLLEYSVNQISVSVLYNDKRCLLHAVKFTIYENLNHSSMCI